MKNPNLVILQQLQVAQAEFLHELRWNLPEPEDAALQEQASTADDASNADNARPDNASTYEWLQHYWSLLSEN